MLEIMEEDGVGIKAIFDPFVSEESFSQSNLRRRAATNIFFSVTDNDCSQYITIDGSLNSPYAYWVKSAFADTYLLKIYWNKPGVAPCQIVATLQGDEAGSSITPYYYSQVAVLYNLATFPVSCLPAAPAATCFFWNNDLYDVPDGNKVLFSYLRSDIIGGPGPPGLTPTTQIDVKCVTCLL